MRDNGFETAILSGANCMEAMRTMNGNTVLTTSLLLPASAVKTRYQFEPVTFRERRHEVPSDSRVS